MSTLYIRYPNDTPGGGTITDINGATGPSINILGGTGISVNTVGNNITITNTSPGSGTVTSVSVVSANGLTGTVANPTTTPAITLSTTITGILQGNGTAISAATTGNLTDVGTDGIVITNGTGAVLGTGTSIAQHVADTTHNGYLSSTDWNTFNNKQDAGVGTPNTFAGFDGTGTLESVPGFTISTEGGMNESLLEHPNNVGGGFTANNFNVAFQPLQNSPNDDWNIQLINVNFDDANSGFSQGTAGEAATLLNLSTNNGGTGPIGAVNFIKMYHGMGNGTDPLTVKSMAYALGFSDINDNVTIDGQLQGYAFQPHVHSGAIGTSNFGINAFIDTAQIEIAVNSYTSISISPQLASINNNHNFDGVVVNPVITTLSGNAGAFGFGFYPTITTTGTNSNIAGVNMNPTITTLNNNCSFNAIAVSAQIATTGATSNISGFQFNPTVTTSHGVVDGIQINPQLNGGNGQFVGASIQVSGTSTLSSITGLNISLSGMATTDINGPTAINTDSRVSINGLTVPTSAQVIQIGSRVEHLFHITPGNPLTGTDLLALDIAGDLEAEDNMAVGPIGIGFSSVGFIADMAVAVGKTVDYINVFLPAVALPDPGFTTGGTVSTMEFLHVQAPISQGGTITTTNLYGLRVHSDFSTTTSPTNVWGLSVEDPVAKNHIAGNIDVGSLSLNGSTSGALTVNAAAVTSSYAVIMPAAQGTGALTNDGAGNLSWTTSSGGTTTFFEDTSTTPQTVTLPAPTNGEMVIIKDISGNAQVNNITINPFAAELIEGMASLVITFNYGYVQLESDGTNWYVTAQNSTIGKTSTALTFTPNSFGTVTNSTFTTRRVGEWLEVTYSFQAGTVTGSSSSITLPSGIVIDTSVLSANANGSYLGTVQALNGSLETLFNNHDFNNSTQQFLDPSDANNVFFALQTQSNQYNKAPASSVSNSNAKVTGSFKIPVVGWGIY